MFDEEQRYEHDECRHEIQRLQGALRNCLLLAIRQLHVKHPDSLGAENWRHILRFCKEGGVEPSPLRADKETRALPCTHRFTVDGLRNPRPDDKCDGCGETWGAVQSALNR